MGQILNVALRFSKEEPFDWNSTPEDDVGVETFPLVEQINEYLAHLGYAPLYQFNIPLTIDWERGNPIFMGAFENFDAREFSEFVLSLKWQRPQEVSVLTQSEEDLKHSTVYALNESGTGIEVS